MQLDTEESDGGGDTAAPDNNTNKEEDEPRTQGTEAGVNVNENDNEQGRKQAASEGPRTAVSGGVDTAATVTKTDGVKLKPRAPLHEGHRSGQDQHQPKAPAQSPTATGISELVRKATLADQSTNEAEETMEEGEIRDDGGIATQVLRGNVAGGSGEEELVVTSEKEENGEKEKSAQPGQKQGGPDEDDVDMDDGSSISSVSTTSSRKKRSKRGGSSRGKKGNKKSNWDGSVGTESFGLGGFNHVVRKHRMSIGDEISEAEHDVEVIENYKMETKRALPYRGIVAKIPKLEDIRIIMEEKKKE